MVYHNKISQTLTGWNAY